MNLRSLSAALFLSASALHAGSFGGPPPFFGGSPLSTGLDGSYQAIASAPNVSGVISFVISNGVQTSVPSANTWIFFVDGQILTGSTTANVSEGKVAGILDSGLGNLPTDDDGTVTLPFSFVIAGNAGAGNFNGRIDLSSPTASLSGKGVLTGTPARLDQILLVTGGTGTFFSGSLPGYGQITMQGATYIPVVIPASTLPETKFKFRGSRLSVTNTGTSGTTTN